MNWYRLEVIRETLRIDYDAALAPTAIGEESNLEVWKRVLDGGEEYYAFLNFESDELLVPEESVTAAAEALQLDPQEVLTRIKARGGLWTGPSPA